MNNTPTPRTDVIDKIRFKDVLWVSLEFAQQLETELAAVTEQLKAAQDGWHDEITKGLSELRRAESLYTKAQERAERAEEQRDRLAEAMRKVVTSWDEATWLDDNEFESFREALQSLKEP